MASNTADAVSIGLIYPGAGLFSIRKSVSWHSETDFLETFQCSIWYFKIGFAFLLSNKHSPRSHNLHSLCLDLDVALAFFIKKQNKKKHFTLALVHPKKFWRSGFCRFLPHSFRNPPSKPLERWTLCWSSTWLLAALTRCSKVPIWGSILAQFQLILHFLNTISSQRNVCSIHCPGVKKKLALFLKTTMFLSNNTWPSTWKLVYSAKKVLFWSNNAVFLLKNPWYFALKIAYFVSHFAQKTIYQRK